MACRVRWGISGTTTDMILMSLSESTSGGGGFYIQRRNGDAATVIICYRYNGVATFNTANCTGAYGSTSAWVHICCTYDGTTIRTYVDGVASGTVASVTTTCPNLAANAITITGPLTGDTSDAIMFSRALTAAEVNQLAKSRLPINRRSDVIGWWPMFDPTSLANAGIDYTPVGNHCTLQNTGANNPAASNVAVPVGFQSARPRMIYVGNVVNVATAAGLTNTSGGATAGQTVDKTAAGLTQTSGLATPGVITLAVGNTQTSGSAAEQLAKALTAAGLTNTSGAAVEAFSMALVAAGLTQTSGAATPGLDTRAAGLTQTTGAAAPGVGTSAAGLAQTTGAAAAGQAAALTAAGLTQTKGDALPGLSTHADGLTQTSAVATGSANGAFAGTVAGLTQTKGDALANLDTRATATTQTSGAAVAVLVYSATAAGLSQTSGNAAVSSIAQTAAGLCQTTGVAVGASNGGGGGPGLGGRQAFSSRRWLGATKARRAGRR
jgi:hypothetical protein